MTLKAGYLTKIQSGRGKDLEMLVAQMGDHAQGPCLENGLKGYDDRQM